MQASMVWRITKDISVDRLSARKKLVSTIEQKIKHMHAKNLVAQLTPLSVSNGGIQGSNPPSPTSELSKKDNSYACCILILVMHQIL